MRSRRKVCNGKKVYNTRQRAIKALRKIRYRRESGEHFCQAKRAYFCAWHEGWHLTKQDLSRSPVASDVLPGHY